MNLICYIDIFRCICTSYLKINNSLHVIHDITMQAPWNLYQFFFWFCIDTNFHPHPHPQRVEFYIKKNLKVIHEHQVLLLRCVMWPMEFLFDSDIKIIYRLNQRLIVCLFNQWIVFFGGSCSCNVSKQCRSIHDLGHPCLNKTWLIYKIKQKLIWTPIKTAFRMRTLFITGIWS